MSGEFLYDLQFLAVKLHVLAVNCGDFFASSPLTLVVKLHELTAWKKVSKSWKT